LQARDALAQVLAIRPDTAELSSGEEVPAEGVAVGTLILVKPGAKVPLDGRVEKGSSTLDESMLTGESPHQQVGLQKIRAQCLPVVGPRWAVRSANARSTWLKAV